MQNEIMDKGIHEFLVPQPVYGFAQLKMHTKRETNKINPI